MSVSESVQDERKNVSVVTILHGEKEFIPLILHNFQNFNDQENLELIVVDDGSENLMKYFMDTERCMYLHLKNEEKESFMKQIFEGYKQPNKTVLQYEQKRKALPNGFKRDYGCGMSSYDTIFHMNADCIYNPKSIERKLNFMKRTSAECVFCDSTLCYDIYNKELYKTVSPFKIYESTLCHTREFWKRRGFQWSDVTNEGKYFHHDNGIDRKLDNYYDTIQILSIHNMNEYQPVKVELENMKIKIPEMVNEITIDTHPFCTYISELFEGDVTILGINSDFLDNVDTESHWKTHNLTEKWKQTKLAKMVKNIGSEFNVLLYGSKHPAWDLFNHVPFDVIFLETPKNREQMIEIISKCKSHEYISVKGIFLRKEFLEK